MFLTQMLSAEHYDTAISDYEKALTVRQNLGETNTREVAEMYAFPQYGLIYLFIYFILFYFKYTFMKYHFVLSY